MKLLSQISRKYKDKKYVKHWIVLPNEIVEALGWKVGDVLEPSAKRGELIVKKE